VSHGVNYRDYGRADAEVVVETAGTIVYGALGLDTSGEAIPYLAECGEANDLDAIRKHAETVDEIARKIETGLPRCGCGEPLVLANLRDRAAVEWMRSSAN
jgi:hypothetical protein